SARREPASRRTAATAWAFRRPIRTMPLSASSGSAARAASASSSSRPRPVAALSSSSRVDASVRLPKPRRARFERAEDRFFALMPRLEHLEVVLQLERRHLRAVVVPLHALVAQDVVEHLLAER